MLSTRRRHCTVLNDPYKHATSPILFCTINSVFSAIISGKLFLSVNITSESCLHEKSPVVFKILVLSRALLGAGPGRAVAPHHGDRDTHTHQPPPSMAIMLQNKHHAISIHFCPSFNHLSHIFSDLCLLSSWSSIIYHCTMYQQKLWKLMRHQGDHQHSQQEILLMWCSAHEECAASILL